MDSARAGSVLVARRENRLPLRPLAPREVREPPLRRLLCHRLLGIRSSLFMDPNPEQMQIAAAIGADRIELYTESYAAAGEKEAEVYEQFVLAAHAALDAGLGVNAGHDLNLKNLVRFRDLPGLAEVSIGHALTVDAIEMGLSNAVKAYRQCLQSAT